MNTTAMRSRWAAVGAAVAVTLGAGGIGLVSATSPEGAVAFVPLDASCRAADTRPGDDNVGDRSSPLGPAETHIVNSNDGDCDGLIPSEATSVQLNVTALNSTIPSFLTIWANGERPNASSLNPTPGQPPVPNAVTTAITGTGDFNIYNNAGDVDVVVDVAGYYTDHHHDDRYYTKTETYTKDEIDTALNDAADDPASVAGLPDAAGVVKADGGLWSGTPNISEAVWNDGLKRYEIDFEDFGFLFRDDVALVTPTYQVTGVTAMTGSSGGQTLLVELRDGAGNPTQGDFSFVVWNEGLED